MFQLHYLCYSQGCSSPFLGCLPRFCALIRLFWLHLLKIRFFVKIRLFFILINLIFHINPIFFILTG